MYFSKFLYESARGELESCTLNWRTTNRGGIWTVIFWRREIPQKACFFSRSLEIFCCNLGKVVILYFKNSTYWRGRFIFLISSKLIFNDNFHSSEGRIWRKYSADIRRSRHDLQKRRIDSRFTWFTNELIEKITTCSN